MPKTPDAVRQRVVDYYMATTERSLLPNWGGASLGFHFGLADETTRSLAESIANTNAYLAERAAIRAETRVLDAGCGVGGSAIWLGRERGARVTGITLVPRQVELAIELARERGVSELVTFELRDMVDTGFSPASFDVVWNVESMCHVVDLDAYLTHVRTLLVAGGRFACIDLCAGQTPDAGVSRTVCDGWAMAALRPPSEIAEALSRCGFDGIEVTDLTPRALLSAQALESMANRSLLELKTQQAFFAQEPAPLYEGHVRAALAMAGGMRAGTTSLAHVLAYAP